MAKPRKTKPPAKAAQPKTTTGKRAPAESKAGTRKKAKVKRPTQAKTKAPATCAQGPTRRKKAPPRAASAASARKAKPVKAKPKAKPKRATIDPDLLKQMREALVHQRRKLVSVVQSTQAQMAEKSGDLPDVSDRASEGFEDELAVGLMAIEAAKLDDIEAAIGRIDDGSYGVCLDCDRPIPRKRLEVLPFVRRCLACEGKKERRAFIEGTYEDDL